jgi:hypothetical protein
LERARTQALGWEPAAAARQAIRHAIRLYKKEFGAKLQAVAEELSASGS